jgi:large subunit ribosomal protein L30
VAKRLEIRQIRSAIDRHFKQKQTIRALGIRKLNQTVIHNDTPQIRGMISKVSHLVEVRELDDEPRLEKEETGSDTSAKTEESDAGGAKGTGPRGKEEQDSTQERRSDEPLVKKAPPEDSVDDRTEETTEQTEGKAQEENATS